MKLIELEPKFIRYETRVETHSQLKVGLDGNKPDTWPADAFEIRTGERVYHVMVPTLAEAQGICFLCPHCYGRNGMLRPGVHSVVCWSSSRGVPDDAVPGPGRWRLVGNDMSDLSLMEEPGKSRSVLLLGGCKWHGFITNGEVT